MLFNSKAIVPMAANVPTSVSQTDAVSKTAKEFGELFYLFGYTYGITLLKIDDLRRIPYSQELADRAANDYREFLKEFPTIESALHSISIKEDLSRQLDWDAISERSTQDNFPIYAIFVGGVHNGLIQATTLNLLQGNSFASDEFDYINSADPQKTQDRVDELFRITVNWVLSN